MNKVNNIELIELAKLDQLDRTRYDLGELSEQELWKRDYKRLSKVYELFKENKISTVDDHLNAAIVFQHGRNGAKERDPNASSMAVQMMKKALELDPTTNKWLLAAAIDRDLMIRKEPQIYGTQYIRKSENALWEFYTIDPSKISDEERRAYRVATLSEQKSELSRMNKKKLANLYAKSKNIDDILIFCREKTGKETEYDITWQGITRFGCQLMRLNKDEEALSIFELLVILYPKEYDPYHSLGVVLVKLEREEEAIRAFEKSLEINPNFIDAQKDLKKLKDKRT